MPAIGQGVEICTSTTRPSTPVVGTMIYETDTASYRWCSAISPVTWIGMIPVGTVQPFAGTTAPIGWLICDGGAGTGAGTGTLNGSSGQPYADLWSVIGATYGGSQAAFNLPDLRGRTPFGKESAATRITTAGSGINGATLGANGGTETHTLTIAQMPNHSHQFIPKYTGTRSTTVNMDVNGAGTDYGLDNSFIGGTGGSGSHQNMPPTIILNYIIKY